jgi:hypothetical protein
MNFGTSSVEKENPPMNQTYPGRIVVLADIGKQENYDKTKPRAHQMLIGVEIVDEDVKRKDGKPFVLSAYPTMSNHSNSGFMSWVQTLNSTTFEVGDKDKAGTGFFYKIPKDMTEKYVKPLLGVPVMVNVVPNANGNAKIGGLSKPPKGYSVPQQESALSWLDLEDVENFDSDFNALPEWIQKIYFKSEEAQNGGPKASSKSDAVKADAVKADAVKAETAKAVSPHEDDIPF